MGQWGAQPLQLGRAGGPQELPGDCCRSSGPGSWWADRKTGSQDWSSREQDLGRAAGEAAGQGQAHLWPGAPAGGLRRRAGLGEGKTQRTELSFLS